MRLDLDFVPDFDLVPDLVPDLTVDLAVPWVGTFRVAPGWRTSDFRLLAFFSSSTETPCFLAMTKRLSPDFTVWETVLGAAGLDVFAGVDFAGVAALAGAGVAAGAPASNSK